GHNQMMLDLSMLAAPAPHWQPRASRRGTAIGNCVTGAAARNRGWAMGRLDWCQNETWNPDRESAFFAWAGRGKSKTCLLQIQAGEVVSSQPESAVRLLDHYVALGGDASQAAAHFGRGLAHAALRNVDAAIAAFEAALACEDSNPLFRTW